MIPTYPKTDDKWLDRLTNAFLEGDDPVFSSAQAVAYLNSDFSDAFPIHDADNNRWILEAEQDSLDGVSFISSCVEIRERDEPCPDCGDTRVRYNSFNNGIVDGFRESCTICDRTHSESIA